MEKLNFKAKLVNDDLNFFQETTDTEIKERTKIFSTYGIVSDIDPTITDTTRPLQVYQSSVPQRVAVTQGNIVTKTGEIAQLTEDLLELQLADITLGVANLVVAEFNLISTTPRPAIYDDVMIDAYLVRGTIVSTTTLADFNNVTLFPTDRKDNLIVLAVCTTYTDSTGTTKVSIDQSRNVYSYNRPWFSPVDTTHRSYLGSGTATTKNPHATAYSDLTSGNLSLYQQLLSYGVIISKDTCLPNQPGYLNEELFQITDIYQDNGTGTVTGTPNAFYVKCKNYPKQIIACYETSTKQNKLAVTILPYTNIVVLAYTEVKVAFTLRYLYIQAAQPPVVLLNNQLAIQQPNTKEVIIASGKEFSTITKPLLDFENSGPIPFDFRCFVDSLGNFVKNPTIILPAIKLASMTVPYYFDTTLNSDSKIIIGLTQATSGCTIVLKLTGKDALGNISYEEITFSPTWTDSVVPNASVNPNQFQTTTNKFSVVTSLEVLTRTGDGQDSTIIVYADYSEYLYEALLVAETHWNGLALSQVTDERRITAKLPIYNKQWTDETLHVPFILNQIDPVNYPYSSNTYKLLTEDFSHPQYIDWSSNNLSAVQGTGTITFDNLLLANNDTVTVSSGKTITAKTSGANPNLGQFNLDTNQTVTRDNIIATINNTVFASGVVASSSGDNKVTLTASTNDYNFLITKNSYNLTAILISGYKNGFLAEKFITRDRFYDYLDTDLPTSNPELISCKYRSNALTLTDLSIRELIFVGYGVEEFYGVWLKPTYHDRPDIWQPWIQGVLIAPNIFSVPFADSVVKFSFELFGRMQGISIFAVR